MVEGKGHGDRGGAAQKPILPEDRAKFRQLLAEEGKDLETAKELAMERASEVEQVASKANKAAEQIESVAEVVKKTNEDLERTAEHFRIVGDELEKRSKALNELTRDMEPKQDWNWKRLTWAAVSTLSGFGLAWFLRRKAPILNYAAAADTGSMAFGTWAPLRKHKAKGAAISGLAARWAHDQGDNLAGTFLEVGLATVSYSHAIFAVGEHAVEGFEAGYKAGMKKVKEVRQKEVTQK